MSVRTLKPLALSAIIATAAFLAPTIANADDGDDIVAGALIGIAAVAILSSIADDSSAYDDYDAEPYPARSYRRPARAYEERTYYNEPEYFEEEYEAAPSRRYYGGTRQAAYASTARRGKVRCVRD